MAATIQDALYSSLTSLDVSQQQINVISNNIANANTPGYAQENQPTSALNSGGIGSGVLAEPIQRMTNAAATATANQANGAQSYSQEMVNVLTSYTQVLGQASSNASLPSMISALSSQLTTLSASPADPTAQNQTVTAAQNVVGTLHSLDTAVSSAREQADQGIAAGVDSVNATLKQLASNQTSMQAAAAAGSPVASYQDKQDQLIASLSKQLPVKVYQNGNNGIIVTTDQGTSLFDGQVHPLSFTPTSNIPSSVRVNPNSSLGQSGGLGTVTVNGRPIQMSQNGSIAADLQLRDVTLPGFSDQLDSVAGNLIKAFQAADPTVSATNPTGLFTNGGAALAASTGTPVAGLAGTIALNAAVDPTAGGNAALIQAGVHGTVSSSTASDNSTVLGYVQALQTTQTYPSNTGLPTSMTVSDAAAQVSGLQQSTLTNWTSLNSDRTMQSQAASTALSGATGVNIDDQLQRLMTIQQTYSASAQVIQAASTMLNQLIQTV
ncbi:MAG: flagellar hook-associated protein FlgK [Rhodospirillales bacterium 20-64-7]|nr:MAG: flagellar hook-associated protein FlgK [Rhodospirillales bacterium 20-64-7]HQT75723.1 flagellar hook-associated protein FlgK [Rhodopila sp.]